MKGILDYGRYDDDTTRIGCPMARTDMTPCAARDGRLAADEGVCVGCSVNVADAFTEFVRAATEPLVSQIATGTQPGGESGGFPGSSPGLPLAPQKGTTMTEHDPREDGRTHFYGDGCDPPHAPPDETPSQTVTIVIELPAPVDAVADVISTIGRHWSDAVIDMWSPQGWRITVQDRKNR